MSLDKARLNKSVRKLQSFLKRTRRRPSPKKIHDFRTCTRRFEAALETFAMNFRRNEQRLLRDLSRLRKQAGKIRDMDVLTGCVSTAQVDGENARVGWKIRAGPSATSEAQPGSASRAFVAE
jgi:CHAD domain-containing protein